ncbi:hypothetical protein DFA_08010 [Cavenderia fasciculata]|uniref:PRELI/MSF1 domain-containing protein n=1 Tax=Cavenderia fasciculata TaxID=261658 RepID=F4Q4M0_CACFS|nr:uncharacterized protein DFA_08010 [Cavenderia fasciculata]EGG17029.1 hypothetical protein DFA_08010 [Cavenderia fasciculata]|eukprot:XP_004355513.1 hypothetical protein DFA_08010 [Cavenderia fasciculata]
MVATHSFEPYTYECSVEMYLDVYWSRFPQHPLFPYILDSEVIEKKQNPDGTETVFRRTKLDVDAPGWLKSLFGLQYSYFIEEATIDRANRKVTIKTINETLNTKAKMEDITVYTVHPENPNWCCFTQTGNVELLVSALGFQKKIEKFKCPASASAVSSADASAADQPKEEEPQQIVNLPNEQLMI